MSNMNDIEKQILELLYRRDIDDDFELKILTNSLNLTETDNRLQTKEAAYYLNKLKELGFIEIGYQPNAFTTGGNVNNKYRNNVTSIMWENVKLTFKGRSYVVECRKTKWDKLKSAITNFFKDIGSELRNKVISHIVTFILGIIATAIYFLYIAN